MYAVVNQLVFRDPIDPLLFADARRELEPRMRGVAGFEAFHIVQTSPTEATLVIVGDTAETLDRLATEVGSPWMRERVVPLLSAPPGRRIGPIIASTDY